MSRVPDAPDVRLLQREQANIANKANKGTTVRVPVRVFACSLFASSPLTQWQSFVNRVHTIIRAVPRGHVVTYGQVARLAGRPRAAREVGWIAHAGGEGMPWQRVVNRSGGLARGYTGGREGHRRALHRDGVRIGRDGRVDLAAYLWWPDLPTSQRLGLPLEAMAALPTHYPANKRTGRTREHV